MENIYYKRVVDDLIYERLDYIGAILIEGPKWCGKTTTSQQHAKSVLKLQDPKNKVSNLELATIDPYILLEGEKPRLIDEWQIAPVLWDAVRTSVDDLNEVGLYLLTGSTSVDGSKIMHSGTGRIHRLLMRPMSLYESKESNGKISLINLFNNPNLDINRIKSDLSFKDLIFATCRGGWPSTLNIKSKKGQLFIVKNYIDNICNIDISTVDGVKRDPIKVKKILKSYSRNISTIASNKTIMKGVKEDKEYISEPTFYSYVDALKKLFVIDNVSSWNPNIRSSTSIRTIEKKEFIDPSIAVASLKLNMENLLYDLKTFGFIFENLCIRDLKVYSSLMDGEVSYYRDRFDLEADCVLHLEDGRYALIEFKVGTRNMMKVQKIY